MKYQILKIREYAGLKEEAAQWFHSKWNIPMEAYLESMEQCLKKGRAVPQWYVTVDGDRIVGGLGVIENDFHDRKDLTPNVCAVYVEEAYRCQGLAGEMLDAVCRDMREKGLTHCICLQTMTLFMRDMAGSSCVWFRGTGKKSRPGCICTGEVSGSLQRLCLHSPRRCRACFE